MLHAIFGQVASSFRSAGGAARRRDAGGVLESWRTTTPTVARVLVLAIGLFAAAVAGAAEKASPRVSVSVRGVPTQTVEQGEPWRVVIRLDLPRGRRDSVVLAPPVGAWTDAVAVELYPAEGNAPVAQAQAVGKPATTQATIDAKHLAGGLWRFSPEAMQSVAPGNYVLKVRLALTGGSGWTGTAQAQEIPLTVVAAAAKPSVQGIANRAHDLLLTGKIPAAAALLDAELKQAPRDYALLKVRAVVAEQAGNPYAALMCLNAANFSPAKKTIGQPLGEDGEMLARLERARQTAAPDLPAWTWPSAEVLLALAEEGKKSGFILDAPAGRAPSTPPGGRSSTPPATAPATTAVPTLTTPAGAPARAVALPASNASAVAPTTTPSSVPAISLEPKPGVNVPSSELNDAKIVADPAGQWAVAATAGSQYDKVQYSAAQATGAPNISVAGNSPEAWCPAGKDTGTDWLEVSFANPVRATEVRIRQNNTLGAIAKIEAIEANGTTHVWWEGSDPNPAPRVREIVWFAVRVPVTAYAVARVKITLNLAAAAGWKQIDAVQLVGTAN